MQGRENSEPVKVLMVKSRYMSCIEDLARAVIRMSMRRSVEPSMGRSVSTVSRAVVWRAEDIGYLPEL
jgi:hypothetical protein